MKANLQMNECFQVDETFLPAMPIARRKPKSSLVIHFLYLQAACIYGWFYDLVDTGAHLSS